ncbi:KRAB-A domain-containing protein 2-like [Leptopilina boulardi]|uniref:KRAB-A domain-containing protein 2-like n=1 Tax=Leptopilina boulardi TaxID=63433 RepID=UPI0021F5D412|nr:KRAB-A domain-containing protein 2-like [Leptopilina boulardi]
MEKVCKFDEKVQQHLKNLNPDKVFTTEKYNSILSEVREAKDLHRNKKPMTTKHYRRLKRFDIINIGATEKLIENTKLQEDGNREIRYFCKVEEYFHVLDKAHADTQHKRTRVMEAELKKKYVNISRHIIDIYLSLCEECQLKKKTKKRGLVVRPILSSQMNSRCQVDLIDMQSEKDGEFRFILNYQDHLTKFTMLKALKTKTAKEVAYHLVDIFCIFGAPYILQSDNGREFRNQLIESLAEIWNGLKMVHGKPRHSQSQGSVERSNQDVRDMLISWMADNNNNHWSEGLRFIQSKKNRVLHSGIKTSPYEAMFGCPQKIGLSDSPLLAEVYSAIETEEQEDCKNKPKKCLHYPMKNYHLFLLDQMSS